MRPVADSGMTLIVDVVREPRNTIKRRLLIMWPLIVSAIVSIVSVSTSVTYFLKNFEGVPKQFQVSQLFQGYKAFKHSVVSSSVSSATDGTYARCAVQSLLGSGILNCTERNKIRGFAKLLEPQVNSKCVDATRTSNIVDFDFKSKGGCHAYFHRLIDCTIPNFQLFVKALELLELSNHTNHTRLIVPQYLTPIFDVVFPVSWHSRRLGPSTCYYVSPDTNVFYERRSKKGSQQLRSQLDQFRQHSFTRLGILPQKGFFLYIERRRTRALQSNVRQYLQQHVQNHLPQLSFMTYNGNEDFKETIRLFAKASVVFGFHGAGHANSIFSPDGCIVVELTFFDDAESKHIWRSNRKAIKSLRPSIRWITHGIDILTANIKYADEIINRSGKVKDVDHYLKRQRLFTVPYPDLHNIALLIEDLIGCDDISCIKGTRESVVRRIFEKEELHSANSTTINKILKSKKERRKRKKR